MGIEQPGEHHDHAGRGETHLGEPALAGAARELGPVGQRRHGRAIAGRVKHRLQGRPQLLGQLAQDRPQRLHDLLRGALLQLAQQGAPKGSGSVLEAVDHHPPDSRASQLQQDAGVRGREIGVNQ